MHDLNEFHAEHFMGLKGRELNRVFTDTLLLKGQI